MRIKPRGEKPEKNIQLTDQDIVLLETLYAYDGSLGFDQICQLLYPDKDRTYVVKRLQLLFEYRYINKPTQEQWGEYGITGLIYWLDKKGYQLVKGLQGDEMTSQEGRLAKDGPKAEFVRHHLATCDVRIAIVKACETDPRLQLVRWVTDGTFNHWRDQVPYTSMRGRDRKKAVVPDGFCLIKRLPPAPGQKVRWFAALLEIDLSNHRNDRFADEKVRAGGAYLGSKPYQQRLGVKLGRWLIVTKTPERMGYLMDTTRRAGGRKAFYFTYLDLVTPETVLHHPIWYKIGQPRPFSLWEYALSLRPAQSTEKGEETGLTGQLTI